MAVGEPVLDEIFSNDKDLKTLLKSWDELKDQKLKDDQIAEAISKIIIKELDDDFLQSLENSSM
jgi:myosin-crossreactive antigen